LCILTVTFRKRNYYDCDCLLMPVIGIDGWDPFDRVAPVCPRCNWNSQRLNSGKHLGTGRCECG